jgi:HSP20 family molecular chaperone IbpA
MASSKRDDLNDLDGRVWDPFYELFGIFGKTKQKLLTPEAKSVTTVNKGLPYQVTLSDMAMTMVIDVPGVDTKCLFVEHTGQTLVIEGKRGAKNFVQRFTIDYEFDLHGMCASYKLGQLTFVIARRKLGADTHHVNIEFK